MFAVPYNHRVMFKPLIALLMAVESSIAPLPSELVIPPAAHLAYAEGRFSMFGIFAARLLPVVRHLIGIPAGVVRMNFWIFSLYTVIGSAIWTAVLCWLGVKMGRDEQLMKGELHRITIWLVGILAVLDAM